jgi:nitrogenase subunit NifH
MPRRKKDLNEPASVLQPDLNIEQTLDRPIESEQEPELCSRNYLAASLQSAETLLTGLFEAQAQLAGTQIADKVFDSLEEAFVTRLQHRLQPFVDTLLPEIRDSHAQLQKRTVTRLERRQSTLDRFKQIATLITDECRLTLPTNETTGNLLGFASWDVANHDQQENE